MTNQEYEIKTIADFNKVPDHLLKECLAGFITTMINIRGLRDELGCEMDEFIFIDDGIHGLKAVILPDGTEIKNPNFPTTEAT